MFDLVAKHKRLLQVFLAILIIPPFAFWGIDSYQRNGTQANEVASVDGSRITEQEFTEQLRGQLERMRSLLGRNFDASVFDRPELREDVLEGLIGQRLLMTQLSKSKMAVTDDAIRELITATPAFQEDGKFSRARYEEALRAERTSPLAFEAKLRSDMMMQQLASGLAEAGISSRTNALQWGMLRGEQREVAVVSLTADAFAREIKPTPDELKAYYDANKAEFEVPEQVKVEYALFNADSLLASEPVTPEEVKAWYESNRAQFEDKEERQASHILIGVKPGASAADKEKARAKAEDILAQVKKTPASFADLAKKNSEDPGSGSKGGDLGYFGRGMMVKPFEDAVFAMKPGDSPVLIESEFGFHIIRLAGVKAGKTKPFEAVRGDIEKELRKQRAGKKFAESAETFSNLVYEQSDSLKPAAERFKLALRDGGWVTRARAGIAELNNPRILSALFGDDAIKNKRNTEAVEVSSGVIVAARVLEHKPAAIRAFDEVRADVEKRVVQKQGVVRAQKVGEERLAQLNKGETPQGLAFSPARVISRDNAQGMPPDLLIAVFRADKSKLPAYAGLSLPSGYAIVRISKVTDAKLDEAKEKSLQTELGRENGSREMQAYLASLRASAKVEINKAALEKKPQQ